MLPYQFYFPGIIVHLGYYTDEERAAGYKRKDFIQAKYDFIDEMMAFGKVSTSTPPAKVLDVGCGVGGNDDNSPVEYL